MTSMRARAKEEGPGNAEEANVYVDRSCAGCGTCRSLCPGVFGALGLRTVVERTPLDETETRAAYRAMVTCPVGAIRLRKPDPLVKEVVTHDFPTPLDPVALPGVHLLGYHNRESMGTTPYLIVREGGAGNIMIDAPRFNGRLAMQIEALGGIRYNIVTHEGAAPHHDLWHAFFPTSERVVHRMDVTREMKGQVEGMLQGKGPWTIDEDIKIVALPGYSAGAVGVIYYPPPSSTSSNRKNDGILFSGRTIGWSPRLNRLDGFAQFSRGSLSKQAESIKALAKEDFGWILPSEGLKYRVPEGGREEAKERLLTEAAERFLERGRVGGLSM
jgi:ferredoxin/glyoxylase-like metal-dependent hydrolase (beta-lactamase superfamily II)